MPKTHLAFFLLFIVLVSCTHGQVKAPETLPDWDKTEPTRLIESAARNQIEDVRRLVKRPGQNVDERNLQGVTALMVSARKGNTEVMKLLLDANADPRATDEQGSTPLHYAVLGGQFEAC